MARNNRTPYKVITVILWGKEVGKLIWDDKRDVSVFAYSKEFLDSHLDISPLDLSTASPLAHIPVRGSSEKADIAKYSGLPPFIADSLPDKWGNDVFYAWAARNHRNPDSISAVYKLAFIGSRGMGALEFMPEEKIDISSSTIEVKSIIDLASKITDERSASRILEEEGITLQSLFLVGTSAGGRRQKAIIAMNESRTEIRSGQIMGLEKEGFRYYILKFNEREDFPSAEIEAAFYDLLGKCGIRMMYSDVFEVEGTNHFLTERFDRKAGKKIYTQTLAAIKPGTETYEDLFVVCRNLGISEAETQELYKRMVFDVLSGNTDDHDKNISFIMDKDGKWSLAPAYDVTFTADIFNPGTIHRMRSVNGKVKGITIDDLIECADTAGIRGAKQAIESVCSALVEWRSAAENRHVFSHWIDIIEEYISGQVPKEYSDKMTGWKKPPFVAYSEKTSGKTISDIRFEEHERGAVHMLAVIDGRPHRHVFPYGKPETLEIKRKGLGRMSLEEQVELVRKYLL